MKEGRRGWFGTRIIFRAGEERKRVATLNTHGVSSARSALYAANGSWFRRAYVSKGSAAIAPVLRGVLCF